MRLKSSILSLFLLAFLSAQAGPSRIQFSATQSDFSIFDTDAMLPVWSNANHTIYGDIAGGYGTDDTYIISPGLGYRTIHENQIFGGGLFADYERTSLDKNFWVISPGIEWMNASWDAHMNAYFPVQSRQQNGNTDFAENYAVYEYGRPHGYSYDDAYLTPYVVIGNGIDTEVGYSFDQGNHLRSRVFMGGYYYHPQDAYNVDNINGVTAGYTKSLTKNFTVSLLNSYDNLDGYTLGVNLTATLGGDSNEYSSSVQDRMLDPVERHIGIIDTGAGTNDQQSYQVTGQGTINGVGYVSPNGTGEGTYEDPAALTQENLDMFHSLFPEGARIYVEGGANADYALTSSLSLYDGQDVFGRAEGYTAPASSDKQPQINGATGGWDVFDITNGVNTISDVTINGQSDSLSGIYIIGDSHVTLSDVNVSGFPSGSAGVFIYNTADLLELNITDSEFNNNGEGIHAENAGSGELIVKISDSSANYNVTNDLTFWNNVNSGFATGVSVLTVNNSKFLNTGITSGNTGIVIANGSNGRMTVTINDSNISGNRSSGLEIVNNTNGGDGAGSGTGDGEISVTVNDSVFNRNGSYPLGEGPGIYVANNGPGTTNLNINRSAIRNNTLYGLSVDNAQAADDAQSIMNVQVSKTLFGNNKGGYAIFGVANAGTSTIIDYANTLFVRNTATNQSDGDNITWGSA